MWKLNFKKYHFSSLQQNQVMPSIFKQKSAIPLKIIFIFKRSFFFFKQWTTVNMSYLPKGLFFDVRCKILFTTENIAGTILPDRFCLFSYSSETINETCHFFPPSHLIKSYSLVQKCHYNISTHSCSVWLL